MGCLAYVILSVLGVVAMALSDRPDDRAMTVDNRTGKDVFVAEFSLYDERPRDAAPSGRATRAAPFAGDLLHGGERQIAFFDSKEARRPAHVLTLDADTLHALDSRAAHLLLQNSKGRPWATVVRDR